MIRKNKALAASPRVLEQFPVLARAQLVQPAAASQAVTLKSPLSEVLKNRALAASPRVLEQFPELARRGALQAAERHFEVAPLK